MRFERSVWLVNPEKTKVYAQAKTTWLLLDKSNGRPKRVDEELLKVFEGWMVV
jgi:acyl-CoA thioesterase FadM